MIFVFGSNLAGIHGAGAAEFAMIHHGAQWGVGVGPFGNSYAIPTKDWLIRTLPLERIKPHVDDFLQYARISKKVKFQVTAIGCGLAGYTPQEIAPMFKDAPSNCIMPPEWDAYFEANPRNQ